MEELQTDENAEEIDTPQEDETENIEPVTSVPLLKRIEEVWGNLRAIVTFSGNIILWIAATIFFAIQNYDGIENVSPTASTICQIMMVVCIVLAVIMAVSLVFSIVYYVKKRKTDTESAKKA